MSVNRKKSTKTSKPGTSPVTLVEARKANEAVISYLLLRKYPQPQFQVCGLNAGHRRGGVKLCTGASKDEGENFGYWYQFCLNKKCEVTCIRRHREPPLEELHADEELHSALLRRECLRPVKRLAPTGTQSNAPSNLSNLSNNHSNTSNSSLSSAGSNSSQSHSETSSTLSSAATSTHLTSNSSGDHSTRATAGSHSTSRSSNDSISYSPNLAYQPSSQSTGLASVSLGSNDSFSSAMPSYPSSQQSHVRSPSSRSHRTSHRVQPYKRPLSSSPDNLTTTFDVKPRVSVPKIRNNSPKALETALPILPVTPAARIRAHRKKAQPPRPEEVIDLCSPSPELLPKKAIGPVVLIDLCTPSPPPPTRKSVLTASGSLPAGVSYTTRSVSPAAVGVTIEVFIFFSRVSYHETKIYYFVEDCEFQLDDQRGVFKSFGYTEEMGFNIFQPAVGKEGAAWLPLGWKDIIPVKRGDRIVLKIDGLKVDTADAFLLARA